MLLLIALLPRQLLIVLRLIDVRLLIVLPLIVMLLLLDEVPRVRVARVLGTTAHAIVAVLPAACLRTATEVSSADRVACAALQQAVAAERHARGGLNGGACRPGPEGWHLRSRAQPRGRRAQHQAISTEIAKGPAKHRGLGNPWVRGPEVPARAVAGAVAGGLLRRRMRLHAQQLLMR